MNAVHCSKYLLVRYVLPQWAVPKKVTQDTNSKKVNRPLIREFYSLISGLFTLFRDHIKKFFYVPPTGENFVTPKRTVGGVPWYCTFGRDEIILKIQGPQKKSEETVRQGIITLQQPFFFVFSFGLVSTLLRDLEVFAVVSACQYVYEYCTVGTRFLYKTV